MRFKMSDFLITGNFGMLSLDSERSEVIKHLGNPMVFEAGTHQENSSVFKYGGVEIWFSKERIALIAIHFSNKEILPPKIIEDDQEINFNTDIESFKNFANQHKIILLEDRSLTFDNQIGYKTANNIILIFDKETNLIDSIQLAKIIL